MFAGRPKHSTCTARESTVFAVSVSFTEFAAPFGTPLLFFSTISRWHLACISAISRSTSGLHRRGPEGAALPHHARPSGAAATLGLPPSTLEARIKKLNIRKSRFKLG